MTLTPKPRVYRVGQLSRRVGQTLERWGEVWVEGEISDLRRAGSGHVYLTLNDWAEVAQIRCVMFASDAARTKAKLSNDVRVRVRGRFDLYRPRGSFQLVVRVALPAGDGDRREQLERLKKKLAAEGLFALDRKRPIPRYPSTVGVVTSRRGAALHDVIRVASGRAPVRLVLSHCLVQGADAPASIIMALRRIARLEGLDVIILTRGGGSSEDLAAFNDERLARVIAACPVPVVCGVGHEQDESIADLVADLRAATPSNAAELVVPDLVSLIDAVESAHRRLQRAMEVRIGASRLSLERLDHALGDPKAALLGVRRDLDRARLRLGSALRRRLADRRAGFSDVERRLRRADPGARLAQQRRQLERLAERLRRALPVPLAAGRLALSNASRRLEAHPEATLSPARQRLGVLGARLDALSPLRVLARGYAIVLADGRALVDAAEVREGDAVHVRLARGSLEAQVVGTEVIGEQSE